MPDIDSLLQRKKPTSGINKIEMNGGNKRALSSATNKEKKDSIGSDSGHLPWRTIIKIYN